MTTPPFAAAEDRANQAVMQRLSNARALRVGATQDIPVIFDRAFLETQGVATASPVARALDTDLAGFVSNSSQVVIRGTTYTVRDVHPDGLGMTTLILEATG